MSAESRIWIFQADRQLGISENALIRTDMQSFVKKWKAHGNDLMAGCTILKRQFLVIALDESYAGASGCSIDACIKKVQNIGHTLKLDFFARTNVAVLNSENEINIYPQGEIADLIKSGQITTESMIFDNTIQKLVELKTKWIVPARESWIKRYFK